MTGEQARPVTAEQHRARVERRKVAGETVRARGACACGWVADHWHPTLTVFGLNDARRDADRHVIESAPAVTPLTRLLDAAGEVGAEAETAAWREFLEMLPEGWSGSAAVDFLLEVLIHFPAVAVLEAARKVEE